MILPLPLVPFEEFMWRDDRPAYPMNSFGLMRFSGHFNHAALDAAVQTVSARHPLLTAVVRQKGRRLEWAPAPTPPPPVHWTRGEANAVFPDVVPIDIRREPGWRMWGLEGPQDTDLLIQCHHACCDGIGQLLVSEELLLAYALAVGAVSDPDLLKPLDESRLLGRGQFGLTAWKFLKALPRQLVGLLGVRQFYMRRPVPLAAALADSADGAVPEIYPALGLRQLPAAELDTLHALAKRREVTLNDLLVRDWFLATGRWKARYFPGQPEDWLRLTVPINLRNAADRRLPAANVVSMVFLDRRLRDLAEPEQLLRTIHEEMALIKRNRLGLTFVLSLAAARLLPNGLAQQTRADRCSATSVVTNIGTVFHRLPLPRKNGCVVVGDAILTGADGFTPLRPLTQASFGLVIYAGHLRVGIQYNPRAISAVQAEDYLDIYLDCIRTTIASNISG